MALGSSFLCGHNNSGDNVFAIKAQICCNDIPEPLTQNDRRRACPAHMVPMRPHHVKGLRRRVPKVRVEHQDRPFLRI
jgi:hypothetical protein